MLVLMNGLTKFKDTRLCVMQNVILNKKKEIKARSRFGYLASDSYRYVP